MPDLEPLFSGENRGMTFIATAAFLFLFRLLGRLLDVFLPKGKHLAVMDRFFVDSDNDNDDDDAEDEALAQ